MWVAAFLSLSFVFSFGLVNATNQTMSIAFGQAPASFTIYQIACSFLYSFSIRLVLFGLDDARHRRLRHVYLTSFNAVVVANFVDNAQPLAQDQHDPVTDAPADVDPNMPVIQGSVTETYYSRWVGSAAMATRVSTE